MNERHSGIRHNRLFIRHVHVFSSERNTLLGARSFGDGCYLAVVDVVYLPTDSYMVGAGFWGLSVPS